MTDRTDSSVSYVSEIIPGAAGRPCTADIAEGTAAAQASELPLQQHN